MSGYTIPGGSTVQPALVAYRAVSLTATTTLVWPTQSQTPTDFAARVMNVTASAGPFNLNLPPANQVSTGFDLIIVNVGSNNFILGNNSGGVLATLTPGQVYYFNLTDNSTVNGTWYSFLFGAGSSSLSAGAITNSAYDVITIGSFLHANHAVTTTASNPININADGVTHRGMTFEWTGGGGLVNLPLASAVGNGFYFNLINWGTGSLTVTPSGADTVDTSATQTIAPGNACLVIAGNPGQWFTLGRGAAQNFNFTEAVIAVTGGTLVESLTQAQNVVQRFTGTLTSNQTVTFPAIVQIYYVQNATSGAFTFAFGAAGGGTTVNVPQGQNMIVFSDGTNVVNASNAQIGALSSLQLAQGTAAAPSLAFLGDVQTGIYQPISGTWAATISGTEVARFISAGFQAKALIPTGATVPTNGLYLPASNTVGIAANSTGVVSIISTGVSVTGTLGVSGLSTLTGGFSAGANSSLTSGTLSLPAGLVNPVSLNFGSAGTGLYAPGANQLAVAVNGVQTLLVNATGNWTVIAPSSGTALTVNAVGVGQIGLAVGDGTNARTVATIGSLFIGVGQAFVASTAELWAGVPINLGTNAAQSVGIYTNTTQRILVSSAGNVTVNAPSSGTALTVNGAAAAGNIASFTNAFNGLCEFQILNSSAGASAETDLFVQSDVVTARIQVLSAAAGGNARLFTQSNHPLLLGANSGSNITIATTGGVTIAAPASGTALTVNGLSGTTALSVTAGGGAVYTAVFGNSGTNDATVSINASTGFTPVQTWQINSVTKAYIGVSGSAGAYMSGDSTGDMFIRCDSGAIGLCLTGAAAAIKVSGNSVTSVNADAAGTFYEVGFRSLPSNTFSGTLVVTQRGFLLQLNGNVTVPNGVFSAGDIVTLTAAAGRSITQGVGMTLTLGGTATTGSRTIAANGIANILFTSSSAAIVSGPGVA